MKVRLNFGSQSRVVSLDHLPKKGELVLFFGTGMGDEEPLKRHYQVLSIKAGYEQTIQEPDHQGLMISRTKYVPPEVGLLGFPTEEEIRRKKAEAVADLEDASTCLERAKKMVSLSATSKEKAEVRLSKMIDALAEAKTLEEKALEDETDAQKTLEKTAERKKAEDSKIFAEARLEQAIRDEVVSQKTLEETTERKKVAKEQHKAALKVESVHTARVAAIAAGKL